MLSFSSALRASAPQTPPQKDRTHRQALGLIEDVLTFERTAPRAVAMLAQLAHQIRVRPPRLASSPAVVLSQQRIARSRELLADHRAAMAALRQAIAARVRRFDADDLTATDSFTAHLAQRHVA